MIEKHEHGEKSQIVYSVAQKSYCFIRKKSTNNQCRIIFISEVHKFADNIEKNEASSMIQPELNT